MLVQLDNFPGRFLTVSLSPTFCICSGDVRDSHVTISVHAYLADTDGFPAWISEWNQVLHDARLHQTSKYASRFKKYFTS